jgi:hypothetical protein
MEFVIYCPLITQKRRSVEGHPRFNLHGLADQANRAYAPWKVLSHSIVKNDKGLTSGEKLSKAIRDLICTGDIFF